MLFRKQMILVCILVILLALLAACASQTPETVEKIVTQVVRETVEETVIVESTPQVIEKEVTREIEKKVTEVVEKVVTATPEPQQLVIVIGAEPPNLDPGEGTIIALNTYRNTYETLVNHDPDTGNLIPELAVSWEQVDDTTWHFKLREGVTFHDGEPWNAEAAAWNINYLSDPDNNKHILFAIPAGMKAEAVDEYTLEIITPELFPILPSALFFANMASPKSIQEDTEGAFRTMVGTGPYMFQEWDAGEKLVLTKNPDYWGETSTIDKVVYVWRTESSVRSAMVEAGEADIAAALDSRDTATGNVVAVDLSETPFIRMDLPNPPLSDIRVRKAICLSIDRANIAEKLYGGYASPATQLIAPNVTGYSADVALDPYDPDQAKELVAAASADGVPVDKEITVYLSSSTGDTTMQMMEAIILWAKEAGLDLKLELNETAKHREISRQLPVPPDRLAIFWGQHGNEIGDASGTIAGYYMPGGIHSTVDDQVFVDMFSEANKESGDERQVALAEVMQYQHENVVATCPIVHIKYIYKLANGVDWQPRPDHLILAKDVALAP